MNIIAANFVMENNFTKADQMTTSRLPCSKCILLFELFTTIYLYVHKIYMQ